MGYFRLLQLSDCNEYFQFSRYANFTDQQNNSTIYVALMTKLNILTILGGVIMTLIAIKWLRIADINLGFVTTLSNLSGYVIMIFASTAWLMYFCKFFLS